MLCVFFALCETKPLCFSLRNFFCFAPVIVTEDAALPEFFILFFKMYVKKNIRAFIFSKLRGHVLERAHIPHKKALERRCSPLIRSHSYYTQNVPEFRLVHLSEC